MGAFLAVAEEEVAAAGGAEIGDADVRGAEASADELGAIGFAEIKKDVPRRRLMAGGHHVEPLDGIGLVAGAELVEPFRSFGKLRLKLGSDFGADFVAAAADGWADGGEKVGGPGLEVHLHLADGFDDDALERAAPAGVNGGDGALFRVDEENGYAVGGLDAEEETGAVGDRGVSRHGGQALAGLGWWSVEKMDDVGMDLLQGDEFHVGGTECGLKATAVFKNVFLGVPFGEAEIEDFLGILSGDVAGLGAETMDEPWEFCEHGNLEDSDALDVALGPNAFVTGASA